jgi:hypothetical protein
MRFTLIVLLCVSLCISLRLSVVLANDEYIYQRAFTSKCNELAKDPANGFSKGHCGNPIFLIHPRIVNLVDSKLPQGLKERQAKWREENSIMNNKVSSFFKIASSLFGVFLILR